MDDSLSDFQEPKQYSRGSKSTQKSVKPKPKKVSKRIKGQKDIRSALKSKKNELISYTEQFDTVCKKSGLDVDSEQLQLAIALSKSLQSETDDASCSQSLSTQGRISKIRKTLQEYGFKVPETKLTAVNKKKKKHKHQYKLLNTTDEEKHQKITSKYSQLLFQCLNCSGIGYNYSNQEVNAVIYNKATNLEYEYMKDNNTFYVKNLVEKSNTNGCLLKDWAEIPGRPVSPILFDACKMDFSEIMCSQDELDIILSGSIKSAQSIITKKIEVNSYKVKNSHDNVMSGLTEETSNFDDSVIIVDDENTVKTASAVKPVDEIKMGNIDPEVIDNGSSLTVRNQCRSCSPDIFDDEVSCIMEISKPTILSQGQKTKLYTEDTNYMDLTDCANNVQSQNIKKSQNVTKRKSDDYMEITDCAVSASQGIHDNVKDIDLTQSPDENSIIIQTKHKGNGPLNHIVESPDCSLNANNEIIIAGHLENELEGRNVTIDIDLTEHFDNINSLNIYGDVTDKHRETKDTELSDNIDLTQSPNKDSSIIARQNRTEDNNQESMDLTQSSKSSTDSDELPQVIINTQNSQDLDETIILNKTDYLDNNDKMKTSVIEGEQVFDLTEANNSVEQNNEKETKEFSQSFYEDFVHNHSDSKENSDNIELCANVNSVHNISREGNDIDLTQSSDEESSSRQVVKATTSNSSLGKRDEISIDYDEVEHIEEGDKDSINLKYDSSKSAVVENNDLVSNSSQSSQVFDLTDTELNYSMHKSRFEVDNYNFDYGGISIVDENSGRSFKQSPDETNDARDSILPDANVKKTKNTKSNIEHSDVSANSNIHIVTPKNNEYIFKTHEVTPMSDFASMTTPQRNSELDKYGLKPFKRKRAVQILTHLYNQTHPMMELYSDDDQPSPSKKPRNLPSPTTSPNNVALAIPNSKSPKKNSEISSNINSPGKPAIRNTKSPKKNSVNRNLKSPMKEGSSKENMCTYEMSTHMPIISAVDCHPHDWVFQKREKAKVHSCRVPLHIAFHNYVLSRQGLREAILKYEPVSIDVIHKDLVSYGHRYDPKDLLRFLDKKCITVKTADNNVRNKR